MIVGPAKSAVKSKFEAVVEALPAKSVEEIISDYHQSTTDDRNKKVRYPGEGVLQRRAENLQKGIPVVKTIWQEVINSHISSADKFR